jgi:HKD family nuclease
MEADILHQTLGNFPLDEEICKALTSKKYTTFRALVAYVSWGGLQLIHKAIEEFYGAGNKIFMIVGINDGVSEPDALRYLMQRFTKAAIYVFHVPLLYYTFHPKIYIFSNRRASLILIGSNNLTTGGLLSNSECCVKLLINRREDSTLYNNINNIWKMYATPKPPFHIKNLQKINEKFLRVYSKRQKTISRDKLLRGTQAFKEIFPSIEQPQLIKRLATIEKRQKKGIYILKKKAASNKVLLLQVLKETGAGGTQVQIPRVAIQKYFCVSTAGHQTIEIKFNNNPFRPAVICHFNNNTHRISIPEIERFTRPLLIKFRKLDSDSYLVTPIQANQYKKLIKKCAEQTRTSAKKWVIL